MAWILSTRDRLRHDAPVDNSRAELLRELLAADPLLGRTDDFARSVVSSARIVGGFLLVGTPSHDPWHLTAHLDDEARYSGIPELAPQLVRWSPPDDAPAHLSIGLERLERASKGETVLVVSPDRSPDALLERADDARRIGATILALTHDGDELAGVANETLVVPSTSLWTPESLDSDDASALMSNTGDTFDMTSHLMSLAVGTNARDPRARTSLRTRWSRIIDTITGPPARWS
jgi:hypothetical protein